VYRKSNALELFKDHQHENCLFPTTKFFQDNKTEIFDLDARSNEYEMFESMRIYVERFGRAYNYLKSVAQLNEEREEYLLQEEKEEKEAKA